MKEKSAIQIIGTQRSGSNLLRVILSQSPRIASPHPAHVLTTFVPLLPHYGLLDSDSYRQLVDDVVDYVEANPVPWEGVKLDRDGLAEGAKEYNLFELNKDIYEQVADQLGADFWCCKSMANVHFSDELEKASPNLRYIYLYRDGRDVALSFQKAIVGEKHIYNIASQWNYDQQACLALKKRLDPSRFFSLSYEDLIEHPEQTIRGICAFLDIEYRDNMLDYYTSNDSVNTANAGEMWTNLKKPIIKDNSKKFLNEMSAVDLRTFERVGHKSLVELGYQLHSPLGSLNALSENEISEFLEANNELKKQVLAKVSPEDLKKRQAQANMVKRIKEGSIESVKY